LRNVKTPHIDWTFGCVLDTGSPVPKIPSNHVIWQTKLQTFDRMEIIRNKLIVRNQDKEKIESKKKTKTKIKKHN